MSRFYFEQDGDGPKYSRCNSYYVIDSYANPCGKNPPGGDYRTDVPVESSGRDAAKRCRDMARQWNESPPWAPWDTIAAERDGYLSRFPQFSESED